MEDQLIAIMAALDTQDGLSVHQLTKRLGLSLSQLNRALALLASSPADGGLGWIEQRDDGKRRCLWLTDTGKQICANR